jgi:tetratricopeptide (TPR) repeat protein
VVALLGGWVAGCQHADSQVARNAPKRLMDEPVSRITAQQTADVQIALGRSLEKNGDVDQAITAYLEAAKHDPKRADAYGRLAVLYDRQGKFAESAAQYRKALELGPPSADLYCDLGYSLYLQRRWADAEAVLNQTIAQKPDLARAHNNLALVLARSDRPTDALKQFQLGGSSAADAHVNLGLALTLDGRWREAREQYQVALSANPSSESARDALRKLDRLTAAASARERGGVAAGGSYQVAGRDNSSADTGLARSLVRFQSPAP